MATAKKEPKITTISVEYRIGRKVSDNNFGSMNFEANKTETWDVTGLSEEEAEKFYHRRYMALHDDLGELALLEEEELRGKPTVDWSEFRE